MKRSIIVFILILSTVLSGSVFAKQAEVIDNGFAINFEKAEMMAKWFSLFSDSHDGLTWKHDASGEELYAEDLYDLDYSFYEEKFVCYNKIENFKNLDELRSALDEVFSENMTNSIMNRTYEHCGAEIPHFIEYNGALYFKSWAYANAYASKIDMTFKTVKQTENSMTVRAYYTDFNGNDKTYDYEYEKIDGKWVFTKFEIPAQLYWQDYFGDNNGMFPNTSDSAVYITAGAGLIALCCAVICKKKIKT